MLEQGDYSLIWNDALRMVPALAPLATNEEGMEIAEFVFNAQNRAEDIALVQNMGFEVDDDNKPAPENIQTF